MNKYEELIYSLIHNCNRELTNEEMQILNQASAIYNTYNQLTEQLGCPLEVLFKLTKQEKVNFKGQMVEYYVFYNTLTNRYEIRNEDTMDLIPLNQYKISWWMKKDRSE